MKNPLNGWDVQGVFYLSGSIANRCKRATEEGKGLQEGPRDNFEDTVDIC